MPSRTSRSSSGRLAPGRQWSIACAVDGEELVEELVVAGVELARADVLRVVGPVAVGADPDLEERRLVLLDREVAGGGEGADPGARPDEREAERELDLAVPPARALAVHVALPEGGGLGLLHARPEVLLGVLHRVGGELVGEAHPLDLLRGLDRAGAREEGRGVGRVREGVEPGLREGRRLADHAVGRLRAERELEADPVVGRAPRPRGEVEGAQGRGRGSRSS